MFTTRSRMPGRVEGTRLEIPRVYAHQQGTLQLGMAVAMRSIQTLFWKGWINGWTHRDRKPRVPKESTIFTTRARMLLHAQPPRTAQSLFWKGSLMDEHTGLLKTKVVNGTKPLHIAANSQLRHSKCCWHCLTWLWVPIYQYHQRSLSWHSRL